MSEVLEVNDLGELQDIIARNDVVVVDFAAPAWCVPCRKFAPHFRKASEQADAVFVEVDIDKAGWAITKYGVMGVPTVKLFRDGEDVANLESRTVVPLLSEINHYG